MAVIGEGATLAVHLFNINQSETSPGCWKHGNFVEVDLGHKRQ
jgi:hypothetical protein